MDEAAPLDEVEHRIGYRFTQRLHLERALVHASIATTRVESNERLEFLGDAILGAVVCEHVYHRFPEALEGDLTKVKSDAVSRKVCAELAVELGLAAAVRVGKGMGSRDALPQSMLAALFESVLGAVYLDGGIESARALILRMLGSRIERSAQLGHQQNFKSVLQQTLQKRGMAAPVYVILDESGPDHAKCFEICAEVSGRRFASCKGLSKKAAEQDAALAALEALGFAERSDSGEIQLVGETEGGAAAPAKAVAPAAARPVSAAPSVPAPPARANPAEPAPAETRPATPATTAAAAPEPVAMRVHMLAKELGLESKDVLAACAALRIKAKAAQSTIPADRVEAVRQRLAASGKSASRSAPRRRRAPS